MDLTCLRCRDCSRCPCQSTGHFCDANCHDGPCEGQEDATAPDPQPGLSGAAFRKAVRAALSAQAKAARIRGSRYTRKADRPAGATYGPGMARRMPPPPDAKDGET